MRVEAFDHDRHAAVLGWWRERGHGDMADGILPPDGFVAMDEHGAAAAGWVYFPGGCQVAFLDWFVARPGMTAAATSAFLIAVADAIESRCREMSVRLMLGSSPHPGFVRYALRNGFAIASTENIHLVKPLWYS